jgi:glycosyltransferase involved in cell wall biosynthesis
MRVGVDATCWANVRGYGRFTREICGALVALAPEHEFTFFADDAAARVFELEAPNVRLVAVAQSVSPTKAAAAGGARSPLDMLKLTAAVRREPLDVFFSPSVYTFFPLPPRLPALVGIHDCIAERFPDLTLPSRRARLFWTAKVRLALLQATRILTVSHYSARDIERILGVPRERIDVAVEAAAPIYSADGRSDIESVRKRWSLEPHARWFTYVGGFNPHKNVDVLVRAFARAAASRPELRLLLVGPTSQDVFHGDQARIRAAIEETGVADRVRWLGYVPDEDLRVLHARAVACVLPSQCEGFGLPAVEAAASGAAVIATNESPLPELLAGGGLFVPPGDLEALSGALEKLLASAETTAKLAETARERARALTWPSAARAALDALLKCTR